MGTEFKNVVDGLSGQMIWLEIQEGVDRMAKKEFSNMGGYSCMCNLRGKIISRSTERTFGEVD